MTTELLRVSVLVTKPDESDQRPVTVLVTKPDESVGKQGDASGETSLDRLKRSLNRLKGQVDFTWHEWELFDSAEHSALIRAEQDLNESATRALRQDDARDAWAIFRAAAARHAEVGAADSDPEWVFHRLAIQRYGEAGHRFGPDWESN